MILASAQRICVSPDTMGDTEKRLSDLFGMKEMVMLKYRETKSTLEKKENTLKKF